MRTIFHRSILAKKLFYTRKNNESVAAIVDSVKLPELFDILAHHELEWFPLYDKMPTDDLIRVIPYIIQLEKQTEVFQYLLGKKGERACIFLKFNAPLYDVFSYLKNVMYCKVPNDRLVWMRFYDPIIFSMLMEVADEKQLSRLFGDSVLAYYAESRNKTDFIQYNRSDVCHNEYKQIIFSSEQKEKLDQLTYEQFVYELKVYYIERYRNAYPKTLDNGACESIVDKAIGLADTAQFSDKAHFVRLLELGLSFDPNMYATQRVAAIITGSGPLEERFSAVESLYATTAPQP